MRTEHHELYSPAIGTAGTVAVFGHYGRPLLAFPSESGKAYDWRDMGMIGAVESLIDDGRVKVYCVDSFDAASWGEPPARWRSALASTAATSRGSSSRSCRSSTRTGGEIMIAGSSLGAFHAANFALKRADLFPLAICMSGNYDPSTWNGWGDRGEQTYFNNPIDYVAHLEGDHLEWIRSRLSLLLVCGQGQWEDTTGSLQSTRRLAGMLAEKGIRHELDLWGYDVPHDWDSWRAQLAHHLPRFC